MRHTLTATALLLALGGARAHDTWFEPLPPLETGEAVLALGTGNRFPQHESGVRIGSVVSAGCTDAQGRAVALRWAADRPTQLLLRSTRPLPRNAALGCRADLTPETLTLTDPRTVATYLDEIRAPDELRVRWAALRGQGLPWHETYSKRARLQRPGHTMPAEALPGLDLRAEGSPPVLRVGDTLQLRVLHDGRPLAGQMVEFRSDLSAIGVWRQSDAEGRVSLPLPLAARWLARAVHLQPPAAGADHWTSHFISLAFEALPATP